MNADRSTMTQIMFMADRAHHDDYHREDGPAVVYLDGGQEFWLEGQKIATKEKV